MRSAVTIVLALGACAPAAPTGVVVPGAPCPSDVAITGASCTRIDARTFRFEWPDGRRAWCEDGGDKAWCSPPVGPTGAGSGAGSHAP